jgi:hypothetical protein
MKRQLILPLVLLAIYSSGCTSFILQHNTNRQTTTVSDLLNNEILYNLTIYKDYYDGTSVNGIPSFVQLTTGQSQVQQSINGQVTPKITTGVSETDLQFMGVHQVQDNWTFTPIVDPNTLNRLFWLYRAEFVKISFNDLKNIFPTQQPPTDQQGRPFLDYTPVLDGNGNVLMTNNSAVFTAKPLKKGKLNISRIPGAIVDDKGDRNKGWFSFTPPPANMHSWRMGPYFDHLTPKFVWITNADNYFQFALLALGGTNNFISPASSIVSPSFIINNGVAIPYQLR